MDPRPPDGLVPIVNGIYGKFSSMPSDIATSHAVSLNSVRYLARSMCALAKLITAQHHATVRRSYSSFPSSAAVVASHIHGVLFGWTVFHKAIIAGFKCYRCITIRTVA